MRDSTVHVRNNLAQTPELVMPAVLGAQLAQLVEQWTENPRVRGSNPRLGTISKLPNNNGFSTLVLTLDSEGRVGAAAVLNLILYGQKTGK